MTKKPLVKDIVTGRECPKCKTLLSQTIISGAEVDYCPKCYGLFFDKEELRWAKDKKDKELEWLDVDLWKDQKKFKVAQGIRLCPHCRVPFYEVYYGDSGIVVDICNLCCGIWLDRAEFKKIIDWLEKEKNYQILNNYTSNLLKELGEIFWGPEPLREEVNDFLMVLKMLRYKFLIQHPVITDMMLDLPR